MSDIVWKDILIDNMITNYQISNNGIVYSKINKINLKPWINRDGYCVVDIRGLNGKCHMLVHRLVAQAFIPNPENKPQVNHINGIKDDNRVENLEWVTNQENIKHAYKAGLIKPRYGEKSKFNIYSEELILKAIDLLLKGYSNLEVAMELNIKKKNSKSY